MEATGSPQDMCQLCYGALHYLFSLSLRMTKIPCLWKTPWMVLVSMMEGLAPQRLQVVCSLDSDHEVADKFGSTVLSSLTPRVPSTPTYLTSSS